MTTRLAVAGLRKRFGNIEALKGVSLTVEAGQRVALLGHNGAGKSTLMKIVLGLIGFDGGTVEVTGAAPGSASARRAVAYLPESVAFHPALTGQEQIRQYLRLRGEDPRKATELLARVGLEHAASRRIGTYSKGMRQRVGLAQALIGAPQLMVLDEPTSGLDPVSRREFYALLDDLAAQGTAILLSSHALTEVEARTDAIVILSEGRMVAEGTIADLRSRAALPVQFAVTPATGCAGAVAAMLPGAELRGGRLCLAVPSEEKMPLLSRLSGAGGQVADIEVTPPSLEDIYSHFGSRSAEGQAKGRAA
ncbi:ABC transporter ATP-binding protein [Paracoccus sp. SCSIO 75233]|uniref:ABC transporter ATP-binding protein n=1 Tax=Paracoccus sp. SCSIO 75233 TaxID=3017782 RepID=UPI0022EFFD3B|nr:ABC transporter ATP-binding protein [Paracoccus sp. SCSIO 75233]WBU55219.1 ABC transporter ATP-binding protein [Paracoccus sp. SCSIO 75233]